MIENMDAFVACQIPRCVFKVTNTHVAPPYHVFVSNANDSHLIDSVRNLAHPVENHDQQAQTPTAHG
jgi:hypothetical protein